ncbi:MAG: hypothetical protein IJT73_00590 [Selenomonadaceae bacterium]|nr:hypothetical protein [Selenomonadaceae bacterium]
MAIVYKQPVTYEQQKDIIQSQETQTALDSIRKSIADETLARQNDDVNLNLRVDSLTENLSSETSIRTAFENQIKADLLTETNQRAAADFNLQAMIESETAVRELSESNLRDDFNNTIDQEKIERAQAIQDMKAALLLSMGDDKAAEAIENEKLRAEIEEAAASQSANLTALANRLTAEETNRANEDTAVRNEIANEILARQNADSQLQNTLSAVINKEIADRENEVSRLDTKINNAKSTLKASINSEITDRQNAISGVETSISNAISTEVQNRNIAIESATNVTRAYIDTQISSVESNLNDFTAPTATKGGNRGLVPAPAAGTDMKILTNYGWRSAGDTTLTISDVPAQIGSLTFNGNVQEPTWNNFDNKKLKIEGETSGSDAKIYTVTFTPLDIYLWADSLDQTPKSVTWEIGAMKLAKPTATVKSFVFNNATQGITVSNFDSTYESQTGTVSATNVNSYSAVYKLKNTNNTHWSDDSIADVTISWSITPLKLKKPSAAVTDFTYDSTTKTLEVADYNSVYESQTGTVSATNVNSYSVVYILRDTSNTRWSDNSTGNVTITWSISPLLLAKPTAAVTEFDGDGTTKTLTVANYDSKYENRTGTISAKDSGEYTVTYSLKNTTNTKWADSTTANVVITWKINLRILSAAQSTGFEQVGTLIYNGSAQSPTIKNFDANYHELSSTTSSTNAGTYTLKITPKAGCTWNDKTRTAKSVSWSISPQPVTIPTATNTTFTYDGTAKNISPANFDSNLMTASGDTSKTNVGSYSAQYTLKSKVNYVWQNNSTEDIIIYWSITKKSVVKPTCATTTFTYSGDEKSIVINNFDADYMNKTGTESAVNAGNYSVTFSLKDTANTCWADASTAAFNIYWTIARKKLTAAQSTGFAQSGTLTAILNSAGNPVYQSPTITNFDSDYETLTGDFYKAAPNTYTALIHLKDNYCWNDSTTADKSVNWTIQPIKLNKPAFSASNNFTATYVNENSAQVKCWTYDGSEKNVAFDNFNSLYISQGGTTSATNAVAINYSSSPTVVTAPYSATFSLKAVDSVYFATWSDNSTDDVILYWGIEPLRIPAENSPPNLVQTVYLEMFYETSSMPRAYYIYNAIPNIDTDTTNIITNLAKRTPGTYTNNLTPKANYVWADGSANTFTATWIIDKNNSTPPVIGQTSFEYDGEEHTPIVSEPVNNIGSQAYQGSTPWATSGTKKASAIGQYTLTYYIKNKNYYQWSTGSTDDIVINWEIGVTKTAAPLLTSSSFTFDGNSKSPTFEGVDTSIMTQSGDSSAVNAGSYTVTFSLNDTATNVWEDGTNTPKSYTWKINRKPLTAAQSTFSQSGTLNFNGNSLFVTISGYDPNYHSLGGTYAGGAAKTYTAQISPLPNYCWNDGSARAKNVEWTINPLKLVKPSAATTNFTYDKNSHALSISNFNSTYENQTGTASESAAGVYSVTISLKSKTNTTWADETVGDVTIPWSISKLTFAKPAASATTFTYSGSAKTLSVTGYNSTYMTQNGTISETNAGTYSVTYSLTDKTLYTWDDSTTADVVISWEIKKAKLSLERSNPYQNATITYNGGSQNLLGLNTIPVRLIGYFAAGQVWSGDTKATDAGEHTAYVEPAANYTWNDSTTTKKTVKWTIDPVQISAPALDSSETLTYNGAEQSPTLTGYDSNKMTLGGDTVKTDAGDYVLTVTPNSNYCWTDSSQDTINLNWSIAKIAVAKVARRDVQWWQYSGTAVNLLDRVTNYNPDYMDVTGNTSALAVASYNLYFSLKPNYVWADNTSADIKIHWYIAKKALGVPQISKTALSYTGGVQTLSYTFSYPDLITASGITGTAIGNYTAVFSIIDKSTYCWVKSIGSDDYSVDWSIGMTQITAPTFGTDYFDYDGDSHTLTISGFDSATMTKSGTESSDLQSFYTVTISLKDKVNNCWSTGGNADIVKEWSIGKKRISKPTLADDAETEFTYDGSAKTLSVSGYNANTMMATGALSATDASEYNVKISPRVTATCRYVWEDDSSGNVTFNWVINRAALPEVTFSGNSVTYDGTLKTATITNFDASIHDASSDTTATNAGTYWIRISPKANYTWADGTTAAKSVYWKIGRKFFIKPSASQKVFDFTGNEQTLALSNFDSDWMTVTGNSATAAGSYTAVISLKDTANTCWKDATTTPNTISWSIGAVYLDVPTVSPASQRSKGLNAQHSVTISGFDAETMVQSGTISTDTGAAASYTVTFALIDKTNNKWSDGTTADKTVTWAVTKKVLTAAESTFVQNNVIVYQGYGAQDVRYSVYDACSALKSDYVNQFYTLSGLTYTDYTYGPGTHTVTITPTAAACWNDKSTSAKQLTWTVDKMPWELNFSPVTSATAKGILQAATFKGSNRITWSATSSNVNVATVNSDSHANSYLNLNILGNGSTTITVTFSSDWYVVPESVSFNLSVNIPLNGLGWSQIVEHIQNGTFAEYFSVGDSKQIKVSGTVGTLNIDDTFRAVLIGIDHNAGVEGKPRAHFAVMQNSDGSKNIVFVDSAYQSLPADAASSFSYGSPQSEGAILPYSQSYLRTRCGEFFYAFPADLRAVITATKKPYLNASGGISYISDKVWSPACYELSISLHTDNLAYYAAYDFWANGNSRTCYRHDNNNTAATYWARDFDKTLAKAVIITTNGGIAATDDFLRSYGLLPCFSIA